MFFAHTKKLEKLLSLLYNNLLKLIHVYLKLELSIYILSI
jgi:hypothetical protein